MWSQRALMVLFAALALGAAACSQDLPPEDASGDFEAQNEQPRPPEEASAPDILKNTGGAPHDTAGTIHMDQVMTRDTTP